MHSKSMFSVTIFYLENIVFRKSFVLYKHCIFSLKFFTFLTFVSEILIYIY